MSSHVSIQISKEIRASIAKAAQAIEAFQREQERLAAEQKLCREVERSLANREQATRKAALGELAALNQKAFAKLALIKPDEVLPHPEPNFTATNAPKNQESQKNSPALADSPTIHKILGYYEELLKLDPVSAAAKKPLLAELAKPLAPDRLLTIADSFKATLSKEIVLVARSQFYQAELKAIQENPPQTPAALELITRIQALLSQRRVADEAMEEIRTLYRANLTLAEKESEAAFLAQTAALVQKFLAAEGYEVVGPNGLKVGSCLLAGPEPDYPVQCQMDETGAFVFRQLKVAQSREEAEKEPTEYQLARDREKTAAFCAAQERVAKALAAAGLNVSQKVIQKADHARLPSLIKPPKQALAQEKRQIAPKTKSQGVS
ncbi:MAG: hypothetical protein LBI10_07885 [Deltaproteobacteria bacterium]|jgi:hypothetical protein|nr:hypothetical protein [Deltaproteobacteria bacterium]